MTRQTCGQHSCRAAGSKRRALENYSYERMYCMFPISKCRGDSVHFLGTCENRTTLLCQSPIFSAGKTRFCSEVATPQWFLFFEVAKTPKIKVISFEIAKQNVFCSLLFMVLWPKLDYACIKTCGRFWDNFCDVHLRYVLPWNFFPIYFSMSWPLKQAKPTMASTRDSNLQCPRIVDFGRLCHGSCHRL